MTFDQSDINPKKKSLSILRKAMKTREKSPDLTGQLKLQRHMLATFNKQFEEAGGGEIVCCLAGWSNHGGNGQYLTIELSPRYVRRENRPAQRSNLSFIFNDDEEV
jgi:hypothetical protein